MGAKADQRRNRPGKPSIVTPSIRRSCFVGTNTPVRSCSCACQSMVAIRLAPKRRRTQVAYYQAATKLSWLVNRWSLGRRFRYVIRGYGCWSFESSHEVVWQNHSRPRIRRGMQTASVLPQIYHHASNFRFGLAMERDQKT